MICNQLLDNGSTIKVDITEDLAIFRQYGTGPVVSIYGIDGGGTLNCSCGNSRLIGNYLPGLYISVAIRCSVCNEVTVTPQLGRGDVLPNGLDLIVGSREYHISPGMILTYNGRMFTSSSVAKAQEALFRPIVDGVEATDFESMISSVEKLYDEITKGHFQKHHYSVKKGMSFIKQPNKEYPLVWALEYINKIKKLTSYQIGMDSYMPAATHIITSFYDMVTRWKHHTLFEELGVSFRGSGQFYHNIFQLYGATYLIKQGNRVALAEAKTFNQRTPDMYVQSLWGNKFHIETKTIMGLQWGSNVNIDRDYMFKNVRSKIKSCQIGIDNTGILVLGVSRPEYHELVIDSVRYTIDRLDQDKTGLAGILIIQNHRPIVTFNYHFTEFKNIGVRYDFVPNKDFSGHVPFVSSSSQSIEIR